MTSLKVGLGRDASSHEPLVFPPHRNLIDVDSLERIDDYRMQQDDWEGMSFEYRLLLFLMEFNSEFM